MCNEKEANEQTNHLDIEREVPAISLHKVTEVDYTKSMTTKCEVIQPKAPRLSQSIT